MPHPENENAGSDSKPLPVLLIDDELPLLKLYADALAPDYDFTLATSTREALAILQTKSFKVVVCDQFMPGGDGLSFLKQVRQTYPKMQRILLTGYVKPGKSVDKLDDAGLFRFLLKPVVPAELHRTIQDALRSAEQP